MIIVSTIKKSCAFLHVPALGLLWMTLLLVACRGDVEQERASSLMKFSAPGGAQLFRMIDANTIEATLALHLDNNDGLLNSDTLQNIQNLTRIGESDVWESNSFSVNPGVAYIAVIEWYVRVENENTVTYASQRISFTGTDTAQTIDLSSEPYQFDSFDHDNDGLSNFDELMNGTLLSAENNPPVQVAEIPLQQVTVGIAFENDLSAFFIDEEGSRLSFVISAGTLSASGALSLSSTGVLSGKAQLIDEGSYTIEIVVSDGSERVTAEVDIIVLGNIPVVAESIGAQFIELGEVLELDLGDFFTDPEGEPLTYTVNSPFTAATIEVDAATGVFEAIFTSVGRFTVDVSASDAINTPTNNRFLVTVTSDNSAPVFRGTYGNRTARVGLPITPVINGSIGFSDTDDDVLTYSITGSLPDGLTLNASGVVSGIPTEAGTFSNITFVASDPFGEFARSNAFQIQVLPAI